MSAGQGFVELCLELLSPLGAARARRMFGGQGLYLDGLFIAIVVDGRLYLKTDAQTEAAFIGAGGEPFVFSSRGRSVSTSYRSLPPEALEAPAVMAPWARLAQAAALRAAHSPAGLKSRKASAARARPTAAAAADAPPASARRARSPRR